MSKIKFVSFSEEVLTLDIDNKEYTFGNEGGAQYPKFWEEDPEFIGAFKIDSEKLPTWLKKDKSSLCMSFYN